MIIQEAWKAMREIDDSNIYGMKDLFQTVDFMQAIKGRPLFEGRGEGAPGHG